MQLFEIIKGIRVVEQISEGATSVVYRALSTLDLEYVSQNTPLAIKLFRQMPTGKSKERFERELKIGLSFNSKYLAKYYDSGIYNTNLEQRPFIVMEFIEGPNLNMALNSFQGTDEERDSYALSILKDILNGLKILHNSGIIHRDLQPKNVLIRNGSGVIIDFGVSKHLMKDSPTSLWEEIGSRRYWPPECIRAVEKRWFPETDIFMIASCFVHILSGKYIFHGAKNYPDFFEKLQKFAERGFPIPEIQEFSCLCQPRSRQILRAMLAPFPDERSSVDEILRHLNDGTTPQITAVKKNNDYPLSEFLWHIETEDELRVVLFLGRLAEQGSPGSNISLNDLQSITTESENSRNKEFCKFIEKLAHWGILRQSDEKSTYFRNYGERIACNDKEMFTTCPVAHEIVREMDEPYKIFWKIHRIRSKIRNGLCKHRCAGNFDHITFKKKHYIVDPCDHESWTYRLAVQEKLFVPKIIPNFKIEHHQIHVESM